jgi:two-component system sensor histidine kinase VicK
MVSMIVRNTETMKVSLENLVELSRMGEDVRRSRHVELPQAALEVARQLREAARARGVEIRIADDLPAVDVSAAAFELILSNLIANAIKYCDPAKDKRWVDVRARVTSPGEGAEPQTVVEVRDNGIGVPEEKRSRLFERFYRAHEDTRGDIDGTGLGLSIVRETAASMGGRTWVEFMEDGTAFYFSIPTRRKSDEAAIEGERKVSAATGSDGQTVEGSAR